MDAKSENSLFFTFFTAAETPTESIFSVSFNPTISSRAYAPGDFQRSVNIDVSWRLRRPGDTSADSEAQETLLASS